MADSQSPGLRSARRRPRRPHHPSAAHAHGHAPHRRASHASGHAGHHAEAPLGFGLAMDDTNTELALDELDRHTPREVAAMRFRRTHDLLGMVLDARRVEDLRPRPSPYALLNRPAIQAHVRAVREKAREESEAHAARMARLEKTLASAPPAREPRAWNASPIVRAPTPDWARPKPAQPQQTSIPDPLALASGPDPAAQPAPQPDPQVTAPAPQDTAQAPQPPQADAQEVAQPAVAAPPLPNGTVPSEAPVPMESVEAASAQEAAAPETVAQEAVAPEATMPEVVAPEAAAPEAAQVAVVEEAPPAGQQQPAAATEPAPSASGPPAP